MGWDIATWVIVILALLAFLSAAGDFFDAAPGSARRKQARAQIMYGIPLVWRYALLLLGALYSFPYWRAGLRTLFGIPNAWSWPLAIAGLVVLVALTATTLGSPKAVPWWGLVLLWAASISGVWFFMWVVSHGRFVPMNQR